MNKRWIAWIVISFIYFTGVWVFFQHYEANTVPAALQGSAADPAVFMTAEQLQDAQKLQRIYNLSFFLLTPLSWLLLFLLLVTGFSAVLRNRAESLFKRSFARIAFYFFLFQLTVAVIQLPVKYYFYRLDVAYGLSSQSLGAWLTDQAASFLLFTVILIPVVWLFYLFVNKSPKRWWLWSWAASIPLILLLNFIEPVLLEPVFNDFQPLRDQQLNRDILDMARQAGVPADQVYVADMSRQTNTINAYVSGIGATSRIVIWDTALSQLSREELLFVIGHEMGHYVKHHVLWSLAFSIVISFAGFWLLFVLYNRTIRRWGKSLRLRSTADLAAFPLILLLLSMLMFASSPIEMAVSRMQERSADVFAMEIRGDGAAGISGFQKIAASSLADTNPPWIIHFFTGSHPTIMERMTFFSTYNKTD